MTINLHVVHSGSIAVNLQGGGQDAIAATLNQLLAQGTQIMATLDDLKAAMANEDTKVQGLIAAFKDLADKLAAAVAANDPVALQALVDEANATSAAVDAANPPAAPADATPPADGSAPSA